MSLDAIRRGRVHAARRRGGGTLGDFKVHDLLVSLLPRAEGCGEKDGVSGCDPVYTGRTCRHSSEVVIFPPPAIIETLGVEALEKLHKDLAITIALAAMRQSELEKGAGRT
jgi:hypothetical protein